LVLSAFDTILVFIDLTYCLVIKMQSTQAGSPTSVFLSVSVL